MLSAYESFAFGIGMVLVEAVVFVIGMTTGNTTKPLGSNFSY